jgi:hypothetical protein
MLRRRDRRIVGVMGSQARHEIGLQVLRGASVQALPWAIAPAHPTTWILVAAGLQVLRMAAVAALHLGALHQGVDFAHLADGLNSVLQQSVAAALVFGLLWLLRRLRSCPLVAGSR